MDTPTAILIGAALIGASVIWNGDRTIIEAARDARCGGYLASASGGDALFRLSNISGERDYTQAKDETTDAHTARFLADMASDAKQSAPLLAGFRLLGCRFNQPVSY
jgi:hypothetical protein